MPELLLAVQCIEYAKSFVLPLLRLLQRQRGPIRAGLIGKRLGLKRNQTYAYLRTLEIVGLAKLEGKKWVAIGEPVAKEVPKSVLPLVVSCIDYAKSYVLPMLRRLQRQCGKGIRAGLLGHWLDLERRQTYNYLRALEIAGLAKLEGRRWKVA
jgi:hypothetical protein